MAFARLRPLLPAVLAVTLAAGCATSPSGGGAPDATSQASGSAAALGASGQASGQVSGRARAGWVVTGLGDSVTAGSGCDCDDFVQQYARLTSRATGRQVSANNLGVPGQTSAGLAALLQQPDVAQQVADSDIVLVTTGANDLATALDAWQGGSCTLACFERQMPAISDNVATVVDRTRRLRTGQATEILVTDYWNVFVDGRVGAALGPDYQAISEQVTRLANAAICSGAARAGSACIDLYAPFKGDDGGQDPTPLLAADGDHPDADGHRTIAEALAAHGWHELGGTGS